MGSTSEPRRGRTTKQVVVDSIQSGGWWTVLETFRDRDRSTYHVLATTGPSNPSREQGEVTTVFVALTGQDDGWVWHRIMSEDEGPVQTGAPVEWMDRLTETTSKYASEWRERVRVTAARRAAQPTLVNGLRIRFPDAHGWVGEQEFVVRKIGRKTRFDHIESGRRYRIGGYTKQRVEVVD